MGSNPNGPCIAKPVVIPKNDTETQLIPNYHVMLHNDDKNDMYTVTRALVETFKYEMDKAMDIMLTAHNEGVAIAKTESKEHAELHMEQLQAYGLTVTIEPAE